MYQMVIERIASNNLISQKESQNHMDWLQMAQLKGAGRSH